MASLAVPGHVQPSRVYDYDFVFDERLVADPYERMQSLHREAPALFYTPHYGGHWVVINKAMQQEIAFDHERFSAANLMLPPADEVPLLIPATLDPPHHTAYRLPLNRHFYPKAVAAHAKLIRDTALSLISPLVGADRCDFLSDVAEPFPAIIFFQLLGVPLANLHEFRRLAQDFMGSSNATVRMDAYAQIGVIVGVTVAERMVEPKDDLISVLVNTDFGGRRLTVDELTNYGVQLFLGALDTVVNGLSFFVRFLARDQALQAELRTDPGKIPAAVEELLRMHSIATPLRTATRDMEFHGVSIRKGEQIMLLVPAINYDPEAFEDPGSFRLDRPKRHVAFNVGVHRCIGANLATLELRIFLEEWLRHIPGFHLDPEDLPSFGGGFGLNIRSLPLLLDAAA